MQTVYDNEIYTHIRYMRKERDLWALVFLVGDVRELWPFLVALFVLAAVLDVY